MPLGHISFSSINCPTVICLSTICYFSREKPLVKPTAPGSLLYYICLRDLFLFAFIFRSIKPKIQKYLAAIYSSLFHLAFPRDLFIQSIIFLARLLANFWRRCPKGIDNPINMLGCEYLLFVCRGCLRCVAWFSYWFDNLGLIIEGNTYRCCAGSSLIPWGNTDTSQATSKELSGAVTGETSPTSTRFLITNLISLQFTLFSICLSFSSPQFHKKMPFYSPFFFVRRLPVRSVFECNLVV